MQDKFMLNKKAFSLVESAVAFAILALALGSALGVSISSLHQMKNIKNYLQAIALAQEGIEIVRAIRDEKIIRGEFGEFLQNLGDQTLLGCVGVESTDIEPESTSSNCNFYSKKFKRTVQIEKLNNLQGIRVIVKVEGPSPAKVQLEETLLNWSFIQ